MNLPVHNRTPENRTFSAKTKRPPANDMYHVRMQTFLPSVTIMGRLGVHLYGLVQKKSPVNVFLTIHRGCAHIQFNQFNFAANASVYSTFSTAFFTSSMSVVGSKRSSTVPSRPIRNFVKFHLM